jgi:hypothetical protein
MPVRSSNEKSEALGHIGYELSMTAVYACRLTSGDCRDVPETNAYLEAALLHVRSLTSFFFDKSSRGEIRIRDFLGKTWTPAPEMAAERLHKALDDLHPHIAHIGWQRVHQGPVRWPVTQLATDLCDVAEAWGGALAAEHDRDLASMNLVPVLGAWVQVSRKALTGHTWTFGTG